MILKMWTTYFLLAILSREMLAAKMNVYDRVWQNISAGYSATFIPHMEASDTLDLTVITVVGRLVQVVSE